MTRRRLADVHGRIHRIQRRTVNLRHVWTHTDWDRIRAYRRRTAGSSRLPLPGLLRLQWRHGASPDDAVVLDLLGRPDCQVTRHVTRSRRHEFTVATSDPSAWPQLSDKLCFAARFEDLLGRRVLAGPRALDLLRRDAEALGPEVVIKPRHGQSGTGLRFLPASEAVKRLERLDPSEMADLVVEPVLTPHRDIAHLLPGILHTLRICTVLDEDGVHVWPAVLRVGSGEADGVGRRCRIDSTTGGGIAVAVGPDGRLAARGRLRDPSIPSIDRHPATGVRFSSIVVPAMGAARELVRRAARRVPRVRSVGWDVAVTPNGPVLIEGNHNWGTLLLEMAPYGTAGWNHFLTRHREDRVYGGPCRHCRRQRVRGHGQAVGANRSHPNRAKLGPASASWKMIPGQ